MRKILPYLVTLILFFSFTYEVFAITVSPIRFELSGDPGETITQEISITNDTLDRAAYYSSFANFEAQGETGNPNFVDPKDGLGTWMKTDELVILESKETKTIPITINIPKDAEPGGHFAVVFFGTSAKADKDRGQIGIGANTGVLVLLSVNGEVKQGGGVVKFDLKNKNLFYNSLPVDFEYKFTNEGNDRIKPVGLLRIRNTFFLTAKKLNGNPVDGNILPNSTRKFDVTWINKPREQDYVEPLNPILNFLDDVRYQWNNFAFGFYSATLDLHFNELKFNGGKRLFFFVLPWQLLIVILLVISLVYFGGGKLLKRYNQHIIKKARANNQLQS